MRISDHYQPFKEKTLVVVTNNELARLLKAEGKEIDEIEAIETPETAPRERSSSSFSNMEPDGDAMKDHRLKELYKALSVRLLDLVAHDDYKNVVICVPEVNKNIFTENMHSDVQKHIKELVPKNLASMDLANIVRILMEG